jgi:hypothetical protein
MTSAVRVRRVTRVVLVVIGVLLRLAFLSQPMRLDESANYLLLASQSFRTCVTSYPDANNHPLHTVLVHAASLVLGNQPWCLRVPAFVAGVLLIPATAAAFEELFDAPTGLLAAALVVSSAPLVEYSTNARGYTVQSLVFVWLVLVTARLVRAPTRRRWIGFAVLSVLGFYAIPTMLYFFGAMVAWVALSIALDDGARPSKRLALAKLAGACGAVVAIVALLYSPFILTSGLAALTSNRWVRALPWSDFWSGLGGTIGAYAASWNRGLPVAGIVLLAVGFAASFVAFRALSPFRVNPVVVTLGTCLATMTLQRVLPPERVFLPCIPLYLGSCAAGLRWMAGWIAARAKRWTARLSGDGAGPLVASALTLVAAGVPGVLVLGDGAAYQSPDQVTFRDAETIAVALQGILREGDVVYVQRDARFVLAYYFALHGVSPRYLYTPGDRRDPAGRVFTVDASRDYPAFAYRQALSDSDLRIGKEYELAVLLDLPHATLYRVLEPEGSR